ncbi:hypothetical protein [Taklimakanibacter lacteus]|uniref:hypothetical protein n=1 Tax=Taklimakanibacter lacteus TaxID=2268456 RepID=UPI0013C4B893
MRKAIEMFAATALVTALFFGSNAAIAVTSAEPGSPGITAQKRLHSVQQCAQRVGPFATQSTAWQRWRQARAQGYAVSNGVVPCYDQFGTRGYCFNVFLC